MLVRISDVTVSTASNEFGEWYVDDGSGPVMINDKLFENLISINSWPLSYYRNLPFYLMRNDALDRFGNRIEKRYSKDNIREIMEVSGLQNIKFSLNKPFWCVLGYKKL